MAEARTRPMAITLNRVQIPGLAEAVRRERTIRDKSFLGGNEIVCGIEVKQLTLRTWLYLEHAENGFFIPFRWESDDEVLAHLLQILYFSTPDYEIPSLKGESIWKMFTRSMRENRLINHVLKKYTAEEILEEVTDWVDETMMDGPSAINSEANVPRPSYASHPAHMVDLFSAAGLPFTYDEILDMPLKRLWQHWRLAANRVYQLKLTNPSDDIAVGHLSKGAA